jgi:CheY-like chemotaxis protein
MIYRGPETGGGETAETLQQHIRDGAHTRSRQGTSRRASPAPRPTQERPLVMVVEDDEHDREIYGRILCYNGFDVVFAGTGEAAQQLAGRHRADLVLLDLRLPDMSGLTVLERLRSRPGYAATPVIALSGMAEDLAADQARRAGCLQYIEKPASPVVVLHAVEDVIGKAPLPGVGRPPQTLETVP